MNAKDELASLAIRNCDLVVRSYELLDEIDGKFLKFFNAAMPHVLDEVLPGWECVNELDSGDGMSFWPSSWQYPDDRYAFFGSVILKDDEFWLNCLTGRDGEIGIAFFFNPKLFGDHEADAQKLKQKFYFDNEAELNERGFHQSIGDGAWRYGENSVIFHPLKLDIDVIADEYPGWSDHALQPFRECLEDIKRCLPVFDSFVRKIAGPNRKARK